jgi:integrase
MESSTTLGAGGSSGYATGIRQYYRFLRSVSYPDNPFPRDQRQAEALIVAFIGALRRRPIGAQTVKNYTMAVVYAYTVYAGTGPLHTCPRIRLALDVVRKQSLATPQPRDIFLPEWLHHALAVTNEPAVHLAVSLCFFYMTRVSEVTVRPRQHPAHILHGRDISIDPTTGMLKITLRGRKNCPDRMPHTFARGRITLHAAAVARATCPVRLYEQYRAAIGGRYTNDGPALRLLTGAVVTPAHVSDAVARIARLVGALHLTPHSLRAGGATAAFRKGVPVVTIMQQGFWRSERAMMRYIRGLPEDHADLTTRMAMATAVADDDMDAATW